MDTVWYFAIHQVRARAELENGGSGARQGRSGGRRDSGWRNRGRGSTRKSSSCSSSSSSPSRKKRRVKQQKVKEAQKLLKKHDPQFQQWKEEAMTKERAVELQEQAEVLAKVMKEQFDHTINALSPALISSPPFPPSLPSLPWLLRRKENKMICWALHNFGGLKRSCCIRCPLFGTGSQEMSSSKLLESSFGTAGSWRPGVNSLLVMVVERPSPGRRRRDQAWYLTLHANNELSCPPLKVFGPGLCILGI